MIPQEFFRGFLEAQTRRIWHMALSTSPQGARFDPKLEPEGEGYRLGGQLIAPPEVVVDGRKLALVWPERTVWDGATVSARYAAIYEQRSGEVALAIDMGEVVESINGPFTVVVPRDTFVIRV